MLDMIAQLVIVLVMADGSQHDHVVVTHLDDDRYQVTWTGNGTSQEEHFFTPPGGDFTPEFCGVLGQMILTGNVAFFNPFDTDEKQGFVTRCDIPGGA